jgi:hypothetical protein
MDALHRMSKVAYTFVMLNLAAVNGLIAIVRGRDVWK